MEGLTIPRTTMNQMDQRTLFREYHRPRDPASRLEITIRNERKTTLAFEFSNSSEFEETKVDHESLIGKT